MAKNKSNTEETVVPASVDYLGNVPIGEVWADWPRNPRGHGKLPSEDDPEAFNTLRDNIEAVGGTLQTILATPDAGPNGEKFRVVAGYRRFEAMTQLHAKEPARFHTIGIKVRSTDVDLGSMADVEGTDEVIYSRRAMTGKIGELVLAATENGLRQDVTVWDRIQTAGVFAKEGMSIQEIHNVLAEAGQPLSANTIRNYIKIASFPAKVKKRLRALKGAGFRIALPLLQKEYNLAKAPAVRWDEAKQMEAIDKATAAKEEKAENKKSGVKAEKPARFTIKPSELIERWEDIEAVASDDVKATLAYLLGKATRKDLVIATDEDFAAALTGEGADEPASEEAAE